jgi:hypothetical protein
MGRRSVRSRRPYLGRVPAVDAGSRGTGRQVRGSLGRVVPSGGHHGQPERRLRERAVPWARVVPGGGHQSRGRGGAVVAVRTGAGEDRPAVRGRGMTGRRREGRGGPAGGAREGEDRPAARGNPGPARGGSSGGARWNLAIGASFVAGTGWWARARGWSQNNGAGGL